MSQAVRELEVFLAEGDRLLEDTNKTEPSQTHSIMNTVDGKLRRNSSNCFVSEKKKNAEAEYVLSWSLITHIELLKVRSGSCKLNRLFFLQTKFI